MQTIIVSGGAGFIGSHLIERLLDEGHHVLCIDNMFTGSVTNIEPFINKSNFEFIRHDVVLPLLVEAERIYHLACPASPVHYQSNPIKTLKTSVIGTMNMLGLAKRTGARFLLASTSEVYGDPMVHPQTESYHGNVNPVGPRACYDEGKRSAETLTVGFRDYNQVDVGIARIFNTYGPRMLPNDGRVVSNFICQALMDQDLTIYGNGSQTRSFCFVKDMIEGLTKLMSSGESGPINLGNPHEITVQELAETIIELVKPVSSKIVYKELPKDDPTRRRPDISLAKAALNWSPTTPLREGLELTVEYFRQKLSRKVS